MLTLASNYDRQMATVTAPPLAARVLLVEDDEALRFTIAHNLKREGYTVSTAARGDDALKAAREHSHDLIVLDLMLPGVDGLQVCRILRRTSDVPILMLTALGGESDRVIGLDMGADDYVAKPFGMRELMARVRALLRRGTPLPNEELVESVASGNLAIDTTRHEVRRSGSVVKMKPKEYELLLFFAQHQARVFTREQILAKVWGDDFLGGARTVDVHVRWLRQKIEDEPNSPSRIKTVRGSGYMFEG